MRSVEQRLKKRYSIKFDTCLIWRDQIIEAAAVNLSTQGIMLNTRAHQLPVNSTVKVCCESNDKTYEITGIVIHSKQGATGIEFNQLQSEFCAAMLESCTNKRKTSAA